MTREFVGHTLVMMEAAGLDEATKNAALSMLVSNGRLGRGVYRDVYEITGRPDEVLKLEVRGAAFCNVTEWLTWINAPPEAKPWLAPCLDISACGKALTMARTQPMTEAAWEALKVPAWFNDVQPGNWGLIDGRPVCHDYALSNILARGMRGKALVAVA